MTSALTDSCGHHCGTLDGKTTHCYCCHRFAFTEADGCTAGWDEWSTHFEICESHEPGSHMLDALYEAELALVRSLTFGPMPTRTKDEC